MTLAQKCILKDDNLNAAWPAAKVPGLICTHEEIFQLNLRLIPSPFIICAEPEIRYEDKGEHHGKQDTHSLHRY